MNLSSFYFRPSNLLAISSTLITLSILIGPNQYFTDSFSAFGLFYLYISLVLFWIGLRTGEKKNYFFSKSESHQLLPSFSYGRLTTTYILFMTVISLLFSFLFLFTILNDFGGGLGGGVAQVRQQLELQSFKGSSSLVYKISYFFSACSVSLYPLVLFVRSKYQHIFCVILLPASLLYIFAQFSADNRNPVLGHLALVVFTFLIAKHSGSLLPQTYKLLSRFLLFSLPFAVVIVVLIFAWRQGIDNITDYDLSSIAKSSYWVGGHQIRPFYTFLAQFNPSLMALFYDLDFYLTHSVPFFCQLLLDSPDLSFTFPAFTFPFLYVISGNSDQLIDIVEQQPFYGLYPSAVYGFISDFGVFLAPLIVLTFGFFCGHVYSRASKSCILSLILSPSIFVVALIFPIYYISWGLMDLFWLASFAHYLVVFRVLRIR